MALTAPPALYVRGNSILFVNSPTVRTYLLGQAVAMLLFVERNGTIQGRVMAVPSYEDVRVTDLCYQQRCHYRFEGSLKGDHIALSYFFEGPEEISPVLEVAEVKVFMHGGEEFVGTGFTLTRRKGALTL